MLTFQSGTDGKSAQGAGFKIEIRQARGFKTGIAQSEAHESGTGLSAVSEAFRLGGVFGGGRGYRRCA